MEDEHKKYLISIKNIFGDDKNFITDKKDFPASWKIVEYKSYKRFPKIPLQIDSNKLTDLNIGKLLQNRTSDLINYGGKMNFEILSNILYFSFGEKENSKKRFYPSAGGRYPLEVYVISKSYNDIIDKGVYHYNILDNSLEYMWQSNFENSFFSLQQNKNNAEIYIVITSIIERSQRKYKRNALKFSYLETGCASQNVLLLATGFGISASLINHDDVFLENLLDLDFQDEFVTGQIGLEFKT